MPKHLPLVILLLVVTVTLCGAVGVILSHEAPIYPREYRETFTANAEESIPPAVLPTVTSAYKAPPNPITVPQTTITDEPPTQEQHWPTFLAEGPKGDIMISLSYPSRNGVYYDVSRGMANFFSTASGAQDIQIVWYQSEPDRLTEVLERFNHGILTEADGEPKTYGDISGLEYAKVNHTTDLVENQSLLPPQTARLFIIERETDLVVVIDNGADMLPADWNRMLTSLHFEIV